MHAIEIWVNCPSIEIAEAITEALLAQKLVASSNRYAPVQSTYVWDGSIKRAEEHPLRLKTRADLAQAIEDAVRSLHPYDVPPIIRTNVEANADYIDWIYKVTRTP